MSASIEAVVDLVMLTFQATGFGLLAQPAVMRERRPNTIDRLAMVFPLIRFINFYLVRLISCFSILNISECRVKQQRSVGGVRPSSGAAMSRYRAPPIFPQPSNFLACCARGRAHSAGDN